MLKMLSTVLHGAVGTDGSVPSIQSLAQGSGIGPMPPGTGPARRRHDSNQDEGYTLVRTGAWNVLQNMEGIVEAAKEEMQRRFTSNFTKVDVLRDLVEVEYDNNDNWSDDDVRLATHQYTTDGWATDWPIDRRLIFQDSKYALFLGSQASAFRGDFDTIDAVVCMNGSCGSAEDATKFYADLHPPVEYLRINSKDPKSLSVRKLAFGELVDDLKAHFMHVSKFINVAYGRVLDKIGRCPPVRVLIHCWAGVNRSGAAICAFLILAIGMSAAQAVSTLAMARPQNYWHDRNQYFHALVELEAHRGELRLCDEVNCSQKAQTVCPHDPTGCANMFCEAHVGEYCGWPGCQQYGTARPVDGTVPRFPFEARQDFWN